MKTFDIVTSNRTLEGMDRAEVERRLMAVFRISRDQAKGLLERRRSVVKKNVTEEQARKLGSALTKCGIANQVVPNNEVDAVSGATTDYPSATSTRTRSRAPKKAELPRHADTTGFSGARRPAPDSETKPSFKLSVVNWVYYGIAAVFCVTVFVGGTDMSAVSQGELAGKLVALIAIPLLLAALAWRVSSRKRRVGTVTFNIVLTLLLLGQLNMYGKDIQERKALRDIQDQKAEYKEQFAKARDPQEEDKAFNEYAEKTSGAFKELQENSEGDRKEFFRIMEQVVRESTEASNRWRATFSAVQSSRILNYSLLVSDQEYAFQKQVLLEYINETEAYWRFFASTITRIEARLEPLGDSEIVNEAIRGAETQYSRQREILEPLLRTHVEYGNNLIDVLNLLQENQGSWKYEEQVVVFSNDQTRRGFDVYMQKIAENGEDIQSLSQKLIDIL